MSPGKYSLNTASKQEIPPSSETRSVFREKGVKTRRVAPSLDGASCVSRDTFTRSRFYSNINQKLKYFSCISIPARWFQLYFLLTERNFPRMPKRGHNLIQSLLKTIFGPVVKGGPCTVYSMYGALSALLYLQDSGIETSD